MDQRATPHCKETLNTTSNFMHQYAQSVLVASDQYGNMSSISYTAMNIVGRPVNFPLYGEFVDSYMLTTHGNWWREVPSYYPEFGLANVPASRISPSHDYITVGFEHPVIPAVVEIQEIFNPGAVSCIWALLQSPGKGWVLLWDKLLEEVPVPCERLQSRNFRPKIRMIGQPVSVIRVEFDTKDSLYLPSYDAISIYGVKPDLVCSTVYDSLDEYDAKNETVELLHSDRINITQLPVEMLYNVFSNLDIPSLSSAEIVCKKFNTIALDPSLYREINLRPYWMDVTAQKLKWLQSRCTGIRKLDLSWCGMFDAYFSTALEKLLEKCGANITHLRLDNIAVNFKDDKLSNMIKSCPLLKELSIKQMRFSPPPTTLNLNNLTRLDISRTPITTECLVDLLPRSPNLQHLNLTCCLQIAPQEIVTVIGKYNRELISLNLWKSGELLPSGLRALQSCTKLSEIDIGWTIPQENLEGALGDVLKNCPNIVKLGLAGIRNIQDADLAGIAEYCRHLEQLDLMGCLSVTGVLLERVLRQCHKMRYVEILYCSGIERSFVVELINTYANVTFIHDSIVLVQQT